MACTEMDRWILEVEYIWLRSGQKYPNSIRPVMDSWPRHSKLV